MAHVDSFFAACAGAAVLEIVHFYDLRGKLKADEFPKLAASWPYWIITGLMVLGSGIISIYWYSDSQGLVSLKECFFFGAAAPLLFKKIVSAVGENQPKLGGGSGRMENMAKAYFR